MGYVFVFVLAIGAGAAVAATTLRRGQIAVERPQTWTETYVEPPAQSDEEEGVSAGSTADSGHRKELPSEPTLQTRLTGIVGLVIAVFVGAGALTASFYLMWNALRRVFGEG
jgi:hypothetical protein